jgi:hypothetical protein
MFLKARKYNNGNLYTFIWLLSDRQFLPDFYNAMMINIVVEEKVHADFDNINSQNFEIPNLCLYGKIYKRSSVSMLLGMFLLKQLGINEAHGIDASHVTLRTEHTLFLLDERLLKGQKSIYEKYGFIIGSQENKLSELTLQEVYDDYTPRLSKENVQRFTVSLAKMKGLNWEFASKISKFYLQSVLGTHLMAELYQIENKNITIREWLSSLKNSNRISLMLMSLANELISYDFTPKSRYHSKLRFAKLYKPLAIRESFNSDITASLEKFLA